MKQHLTRAIRDTFADKAETFVLSLLGMLIMLLSLLALEDKTVVLEEMPFVAAGLIGSFGALFLLFLWNLACAPYRIERDALKVAEGKLGDLEPSTEQIAFYAHRDSFTLKEAACLLANEPLTRGEVVGLSAGYLSDLEKAAYRGLLKPLRPINPMDVASYRMKNSAVLDWKVPSQEDLEISKAELERYAAKMGWPSLSRLFLPITPKLI